MCQLGPNSQKEKYLHLRSQLEATQPDIERLHCTALALQNLHKIAMQQLGIQYQGALHQDCPYTR